MLKLTDFEKRALEEFLNSEGKQSKMTKIALAVIATAGVLAVVSVAPGLLAASYVFLRPRNYSKKQLHNAYTSLERGGFVQKLKCSNSKWEVRLTEKGKRKAQIIVLDEIKLNKIKRWDKKWRFVIYDIPSRFSKGRQGFLWKLKDFGFYRLQNSVWIIPYSCKKEVLLASDFFGVKKYVDIFKVSSFLGEAKAKKHFKLN